jgi:anti-sigma factor (TIGR02949 family)
MPVDSAHSGGDACESIQNCLDSYIDNELPAEDRARILRHLENCPACSGQFELRRRLRSRLKAAIGAQAVPQELRSKIRGAVGRKPGRNWLPGWLEPAWPRWAAASAMGLALGAGLWLNHSVPNCPPFPTAQVN